MKKDLFLILCAFVPFLTSCGTSASLASSQWQDPLYYRPSAENREALANAQRELDALIAKTREESIKETDTLFMADGSSNITINLYGESPSWYELNHTWDWYHGYQFGLGLGFGYGTFGYRGYYGYFGYDPFFDPYWGYYPYYYYGPGYWPVHGFAYWPYGPGYWPGYWPGCCDGCHNHSGNVALSYGKRTNNNSLSMRMGDGVRFADRSSSSEARNVSVAADVENIRRSRNSRSVVNTELRTSSTGVRESATGSGSLTSGTTVPSVKGVTREALRQTNTSTRSVSGKAVTNYRKGNFRSANTYGNVNDNRAVYNGRTVYNSRNVYNDHTLNNDRTTRNYDFNRGNNSNTTVRRSSSGSISSGSSFSGGVRSSGGSTSGGVRNSGGGASRTRR